MGPVFEYFLANRFIGLRNLFVIVLFYILGSGYTYSQCPVIVADVQSETCIFSDISINNTSDSSYEFKWDFCDSELDTAAFSTTMLSTVSSPGRLLDIDFADSSGVWYGFAVSWSNDALVRMKFGNGPSQAPTQITNLGLIGSVDQPVSIELFRQGSTWYGLVYSWDRKLTRLEFINGLESPPVVSGVAANVGALLSKMELARSGPELKAVVINPSNTITIIDFHGDITYNPLLSDITSTGAISGLSSSRDIQLFKVCDQWHAYISSYNTSVITRVDFGTSITSTINSSATLISNYFGSNINRIGLLESGGSYYLQVLTFNGKLFNVSIGTDPLVTGLGSSAVSNYGKSTTYAQGYSLNVSKMDGVWRGYVIEDLSGKLYSIYYDSPCPVTIEESLIQNPENISYSAEGTYNISLEATNSSGSIDKSNYQVTVNNDPIPELSWTSSNQCIDSQSTFEVQGDISGLILEWDFDDDGIIDDTGAPITTDLNATYGFQSEISYPVTLYVANGSGCQEAIQNDVILFNPPIASFQPPSNNLCSNAILSFENLSAYNTASSVIWHWDFDEDGIDDSNEESPTFSFDSPGIKSISLTAELPDGCTSTAIEVIDLSAGPVVDFSWTNNCFGSSVEFINTSEEDGVSYIWDFGDGSPVSNLRNPSHQYLSASTYEVSLTVSDIVSGCESTLKRDIIINDGNLHDFDISGNDYFEGDTIDLEGIDLTLGVDSVINWAWYIDDSLFSMERDTSLILNSYGSYEVALGIETAQGCLDTLIKTLDILPLACPPPKAQIIDSQLCIGEQLGFNSSYDSTYTLKWDFCNNPLDTSLFVTNYVTTIQSPGRLLDISFIEESGTWYGFATSYSTDELVRLTFGDGVLSSPTRVENLGVFGMVDQPISIEMIRQEDIWYGLIYSWNGKLTRVAFNDGLEGIPDAFTFDLSLPTTVGKMDLVQMGDELKVVIINPSNTLSIIDFNNDIKHNPTMDNVTTSGVIPNLSSSRDIEFFKECDQWHAYISSYTSGNITRVDFGNEITNEITGSEILINNFFNGNVNRISLIRSGGIYYLQVLTFGGRLFNVTIGNDPLITGIDGSSVNQYGESDFYPQGYALATFKHQGVWMGYIIDDLNGELYSIMYNEPCDVSYSTSTDPAPEGIFYNSAGSYNISLEVIDEFGSVNYFNEELEVVPSIAPTINFSTENRCIASTNLFSPGTSSTITSYSWDFDSDGTIDSTDPNPTYQFPSAGTYDVRLTVESDEGCGNFTEQSITIYPEPPTPTFSIPKDSFCVAEPVAPSNLTDDTVWEGLVEYVWTVTDLGDTIASGPEFIFSQPGQKIIEVVATIPGCESIVVRDTIQVISSPVADFTAAPVCDGEITFFNNLSDPGTILWDFGDGNTSAEISPSHQFGSAGTYAVELSITNNLGCETTVIKNVEVNAIPVADFQYAIVCRDTESVFEDLSVVEQADIVAWEWSVNDEVISNQQYPGLTFGAATNYTVKLLATSSDGCQSSHEEIVSVAELPEVDFEIVTGCIGELTTFTDLTEPSDVLSRSWAINGQQFSSANPSVIFDESGIYEASLIITNSQLCFSSMTKEFTIDDLPVPDFVIDGQCNNEEITLEDASIAFADPIVSRQWFFNGEPIGQGLNASISGYAPGTYPVTLELTTENGCVIQTSRDLDVQENPSASFTASNDYGVPPFQLQFTNTSQGVSVNEWYVNDALITTNQNPVIQFNEPGDQMIRLITYNTFGCADTAEMVISSVVPVVDLAITGIQLEENGGNYQIVLDIFNDSNLPIETIGVNVELQNQFSVSEQVFQRINAGNESVVTLNTSVPMSNNTLGFLCVSLNSPYPDEEINLEDNEACITIRPAIYSEDPFPNPTTDRATLRYVLPESGRASLEVYDLSGNREINQQFELLPKGLNELILQLGDLDAGMYMVRFSYGGHVIISRIIRL